MADNTTVNNTKQDIKFKKKKKNHETKAIDLEQKKCENGEGCDEDLTLFTSISWERRKMLVGRYPIQKKYAMVNDKCSFYLVGQRFEIPTYCNPQSYHS